MKIRVELLLTGALCLAGELPAMQPACAVRGAVTQKDLRQGSEVLCEVEKKLLEQGESFIAECAADIARVEEVFSTALPLVRVQGGLASPMKKLAEQLASRCAVIFWHCKVFYPTFQCSPHAIENLMRVAYGADNFGLRRNALCAVCEMLRDCTVKPPNFDTFLVGIEQQFLTGRETRADCQIASAELALLDLCRRKQPDFSAERWQRIVVRARRLASTDCVPEDFNILLAHAEAPSGVVPQNWVQGHKRFIEDFSNAIGRDGAVVTLKRYQDQKVRMIILLQDIASALKNRENVSMHDQAVEVWSYAAGLFWYWGRLLGDWRWPEVILDLVRQVIVFQHCQVGVKKDSLLLAACLASSGRYAQASLAPLCQAVSELVTDVPDLVFARCYALLSLAQQGAQSVAPQELFEQARNLLSGALVPVNFRTEFEALVDRCQAVVGYAQTRSSGQPAGALTSGPMRAVLGAGSSNEQVVEQKEENLFFDFACGERTDLEDLLGIPNEYRDGVSSEEAPMSTDRAHGT